eukprot:1332366-Amphidinium_carterae.1
MCGMANICGPYVAKPSWLYFLNEAVYKLLEPRQVACARFLSAERVVDFDTLLQMTTSTSL